MSGPGCGKSWWISIELPRGREPGLQQELTSVLSPLVSWDAWGCTEPTASSWNKHLLWKHNSRYHFYLRCVNIISKIILAFNYLNISLFILPLGFEMRVKIIEAIVVLGDFFSTRSIREEIKWIAYMKKISKQISRIEYDLKAFCVNLSHKIFHAVKTAEIA